MDRWTIRLEKPQDIARSTWAALGNPNSGNMERGTGFPPVFQSKLEDILTQALADTGIPRTQLCGVWFRQYSDTEIVSGQGPTQIVRLFLNKKVGLRVEQIKTKTDGTDLLYELQIPPGLANQLSWS
jgi:hypothetical protein